MRDKLRSILGIETVDNTDEQVVIHDQNIIFNFGVIYLVVQLFFYVFAGGLHAGVEGVVYNEFVFGGIIFFLVALKLSKNTFWLEAFLSFLMVTRAFDFIVSPNSIQSALVIVLTIYLLYYWVLDFVRLIPPIALFNAVLLAGIFYIGTNNREKIFDIALVLLLSFLATLYGRDRYLAYHTRVRLVGKQEKLLEEFKYVNAHLNGELLKQSIDLMNIEEAEAKFRALTSAINAAIFLIDEDDHAIYSNHWLYNNYGLKYKPIQRASDFKDLFSEEVYEQLKASYRATQKTQKSTMLREIPLKLSNGIQLWLNVRFTIVDTSGILITGFDVTERKINEERIQKLSAVKDILIKIKPMMFNEMAFPELLDYILNQLMQHITHADLGCILMLEGSKLKIVASKGYDSKKANAFQIELNQSFIYKQTKGNLSKPLVINDIQERYMDEWTQILENDKELPVRSSLCAPIMVENVLYGMINMDAYESNVFSSDDVEIMTFLSDQLGYALKTQQAFQKTQYGVSQ